LLQGREGSPAEIHHLRAGKGLAQRSDDDHALPLCPLHHRTGGFGMAFHAGKRTWEKRFGAEAELLKEVNARI